MSSRAEVSSFERIASLIREPIEEIDIDCGFTPENTSEIIGTHGGHVETIGKLVIANAFDGGNSQSRNEFFLNPNLDFNAWSNYPKLDELLQQRKRHTGDPFKNAQEYTEMETTDERISGNPTNNYYRNLGISRLYDYDGVIVTFNEQALAHKPEVQTGAYGAELILAEAPGIEAISDIYPVGEEPAELLAIVMNTIKTSL